jgi:aminoglycoside phosphotransferase (APT) family kinase protein
MTVEDGSRVASNEQVVAALRRQFGVPVREVRRQLRWRPTWFVTAERDGEPWELVVRGERVDTALVPLRHEMEFHRILGEAGLPVPRIHGWNDELGAVVMDYVPGRPDFRGTPDAERDEVVDEYLKALVEIHQLPLRPFAEAGILRATHPGESGTVSLAQMEKGYRASKSYPDPFIEFCLGWLRRHPPRSHGRESAVVWDSGQFHHHNGHLTAILDLEFGHVGDPMVDLAVWRMRSTLIPYGHFPTLYARYEELSGTPVDLEAVQRHYIGSTLANELAFGAAVRDPAPDTDLMTNMQWDSDTNLMATEALAEAVGLDLPTIDVPAARETRTAPAHRHLVRSLRRVDAADPAVAHELRLAFRIARHLQRSDEIGDAMVEADLDDLGRLLGHRPGSWQQADQDLEAFVLADAGLGRYDAELITLFHRRNLHVHAQLGPEGSSMVAHRPAPRFDQP